MKTSEQKLQSVVTDLESRLAIAQANLRRYRVEQASETRPAAQDTTEARRDPFVVLGDDDSMEPGWKWIN